MGMDWDEAKFPCEAELVNTRMGSPASSSALCLPFTGFPPGPGCLLVQNSRCILELLYVLVLLLLYGPYRTLDSVLRVVLLCLRFVQCNKVIIKSLIMPVNTVVGDAA